MESCYRRLQGWALSQGSAADAAESSDRDRLEAERLAADKVGLIALQAEIARVLVTPLGCKRMNNLVKKIPGKPARAAPPLLKAPDL